MDGAVPEPSVSPAFSSDDGPAVPSPATGTGGNAVPKLQATRKHHTTITTPARLPGDGPRRNSKLARLTPDQLAAIFADYQNPALAMIEITARHGISDASVRKLAREASLPLRPIGRPKGKSNPSRVSRLNVRLLLDGGMTPLEVAQRLRIDKSTVNRFLRDFKAGMEPRRAGTLKNRKGDLRRTAASIQRRCEVCLAVFPLAQPACPNGHPQPEVA